MSTFVTTVHVITCVLIVALVLIQSGKGAEISASFGGSSQTVFGSSGGANFFTRLTAGAAAVFFVTSLYLTWVGSRNQTVFGNVPVETAPAAPTGAPAGAPAAAVPAAAPTGPQK